MHTAHELELEAEPDAVPRARHFVIDVLGHRQDADLLSTAELAVSELVTNALLHAGTAVRIRLLEPDDESVVIEVHDYSRTAPLRTLGGPESMTGRGIALVDMMTHRWGVEPTEGGKYVWCEILVDGAASRRPRFARSAKARIAVPEEYHPADESAEPVYTVELGDVPTDLLVAAKEHVDNVVRELMLAWTGAESGTSSALPPPFAELVETVTKRFVDARQSIKRQALEAALRGKERTRLTLTLPESSAQAGLDYLAALDRADVYARGARLLTLETPPQHRAFRRWYVESLAKRLTAAAAGDPPPPAISFEQHLLTELDLAARGERAASFLAERLSRLQQLTSDLRFATKVTDISSVVAKHAAQAIGASLAALHLANEDDVLELTASSGGNPQNIAPFSSIPSGSRTPAREAFDSRAAVVVPAGNDLAARYPDLGMPGMIEHSIVCVPLMVGETSVGVMSLMFPWEHDVNNPDEMTFLASMADTAAQAIDRNRAQQRAHESAATLEFLSDASAELNASLGYRTTLANIAQLLVPRWADWCIVQTVGESGLDNVAIAHVDPERVAIAEELQRLYPSDPDRESGVTAVINSGTSQLVPNITEEMLAATALDDEHLRRLLEFQMSSAMIVPLTGTSGTFGALSMIYAESGRHYREQDRAMAEELASRAALAVERAETFRRQTGRLAAITRIAESTQHAILPPVPPRVGCVALAARYVSAAKEALIGGDLYEIVPMQDRVRLIIGDVRGKGLEAVRLATVVLGFFRAAAADGVTLSELARQMDRRLSPYLEEEDFVTALLIEISSNGTTRLVSCGHPAPVLLRDGRFTELECVPTVPLGLGVAPTSTSAQLLPRDRILMFTDGLIESRDEFGRYVDLSEVVEPLSHDKLATGLDNVLSRLRNWTHTDLDDDLALLAAEFQPIP